MICDVEVLGDRGARQPVINTSLYGNTNTS